MIAFLHPYYVGNLTVLATYLALRHTPFMTQSPWADDLFEGDVSGLSREVQILGCLSAICASRFLSRGEQRVVDDLLPLFFMLSKVCIVVCTFLVSWTLPWVYCIIFFTLWVFVQEPEYQGNSKVKTISPENYDNAVATATTSSRCLVMVGAAWSPPTRRFWKKFALLSLQFSNTAFARVDIDRAPFLTTKLNIDAGGSSRQIPTLILYDKGKEVRRLPLGNSFATPYLSECSRDDIVAYFQLT